MDQARPPLPGPRSTRMATRVLSACFEGCCGGSEHTGLGMTAAHDATTRESRGHARRAARVAPRGASHHWLAVPGFGVRMLFTRPREEAIRPETHTQYQVKRPNTNERETHCSGRSASRKPPTTPPHRCPRRQVLFLTFF